MKWKNLAEEFKKSGQVEIVDISSSVRLVPEHVEQKDIEKYKQASCDLAFVTYGEESYGGNYENYGGDSGSYYEGDFEGNNETDFEESYGGNYGGNYGSGFEGSYEEDLRGSYGDFGGGEGCHVWLTENLCPWMTQAEYMWTNELNYSSVEDKYECEPRIVESDPDIGKYPTSCNFGPGWKGTLKTTIEEGRYMIYWATLVQQPTCVEAVTLIDKKTEMSKEFWTSQSEVNFPVEYAKTTCDMKILIFADWKCFSVDTKVRCEKDGETKTKETGTLEMFGIASAVILSLAVIVGIVVVIVLKRKSKLGRENSVQKQELNNLYGTYYHGVEYSFATDNNPTYNEDEGNADAVVTDENVYYQL